MVSVTGGREPAFGAVGNDLNLGNIGGSVNAGFTLAVHDPSNVAGAHVAWQDISSSTTYCSASDALSMVDTATG